jgi:PKD repeat protein
VSWDYNEQESALTTSYLIETELKESGNGNLNEVLTALYRHQWLYTNDPLTDYTYESARGMMKVFKGNSFSTNIRFSGILPGLPNPGTYNQEVLLTYVEQAAQESLQSGPTYENGKAMGRFAQLVHIADQIGALSERDYFLNTLKNRLQDWLTAGGAQEYSYNAEWDVLTGYPSGFGADREINDHHFHSSYAIRSAATIAQYDSAWATQDNWGAMINLLIKDANNWDRNDEMFPFLRSHSAYAGHSWASGHGGFGDGNNQESSSESMNFASAVFLWGSATGQTEIRDLGVFLHANEMIAIEQYWFDVNNAVFPDNYAHLALGIVWGGKGVHGTWFGADPEFIHGINFLPLNSGSMYLGRHPGYVIDNYNEILAERNGNPVVWKDVFWMYLALSDADQALALYNTDPNYQPFDGESRAHTMYWLYNFRELGRPDTTITADIPEYSVFITPEGDTTYAAFNPNSDQITVSFSDGFNLVVPSKQLRWHSTNVINPNEPVISLTADKLTGKTPLHVRFDGSKSFDPNGESLTFKWNFGNSDSSTLASPEFTFTDPGDYKVRLTIENTSGFTNSDSVMISVFENGTPYFTDPVMVPAKIEAENYDKGGQGIAYNDVEENNIGLAYRPDEGVDIERSNDGGYDVYWIVAGEWIEYTIEVPEDAEYDITPYVSTVPGFGNFQVLIDNEPVSDIIDVPNTGGWQNWTPKPINNVFLEEGVHIVRFNFDSDTDKEGWLFSLNYFDVSYTNPVSNEMAEDLPKGFTISQNYPNPFNPTTTFDYSLPTGSDVIIEVKNVLGQTVAIVVNEFKSAGEHSATFNATGLSSGIYFYSFSAGGITQSGKMTLLK